MGDSLKTIFSPAVIDQIGAELERVHPAFPRKAFVKEARNGLDELELLDRARQIARALGSHLPSSYPEAIEVLLRSLGPEQLGDENLGGGMGPFLYMPYLIFVADRGLQDFDLSMRAQHELTRRFTAEFSIRSFIAKDPDRTFAYLTRWSTEANPHVRRLVSEGTRLRLPWGTRVRWLDENPERVVALLERLKDDPSSMVRRSVANNLNDLGKVHPKLLVDLCRAWLVDASPDCRALVEHALRSAVKRGEPGALGLLGYGEKVAVEVEDVRFAPRKVRIGERVAVSFAVRSTSRSTQELLVDLAVHFVKANGKASPKVFKLDRVTLPARGRVSLQTTVSLAVHTTRKPRPGVHVVEARLNGQSIPLGSFQVVAEG